MTTPVLPGLIGLGAPELLIVLAVVVLLFGATKLPDLARGSGRALRIFKAETKGLIESDEPSAYEPADQAVTTIDHPTEPRTR